MTRKFLAFFITILIIGLLALVGVGITYFVRISQIDVKIQNFIDKKTTVSFAQPSSFPVLDSLNQVKDQVLVQQDGKTNLLTSEVLKIKVQYQKSYLGTEILSKRVNNKLLLYYANQNPEDGQSIELFNKETKESLKDAINRIFLNGVSASTCLLQNVENTFNYPATYSLAQITYTTADVPAQCPKAYSKSKNLGFFIYDSNFPDRFGYIRTGDILIPGSTTSSPWFETIKFY